MAGKALAHSRPCQPRPVRRDGRAASSLRQPARREPFGLVTKFFPNAKLRLILDVRRLRVLHAVNEYGSVTAAAAALGYSAPAVSQQLAVLEREVGMELTERAGRGIGLTPAANILVAYTDTLLARLGQPFPAPRSDTSSAEMIQRACARAGFVPCVVARLAAEAAGFTQPATTAA